MAVVVAGPCLTALVVVGLDPMLLVAAGPGTGGLMKTATEGAWNAREGAQKKKVPTRVAS
jgi:hypothetical protein